MKRATISFLAAAVAAVALVGSAVAAAQQANPIMIVHATKGCHVWMVNGKSVVRQTVKLSPGKSLTIMNTDLMPHQLVKTAGGTSFVMKLVTSGNPSTGTLKPPYAAGMMPHMSSILRVTFPKAGVYTFTTKAGEDYQPVKTVGEDNVLKIKVIVG